MNPQPNERWAKAVVFAWTVLVSAADTKVSIHPRLHWFATGVALLLLLPFVLRNLVLPYLSQKGFTLHVPGIPAACAFIATIFVPAAYAANLLESAGAAAKLAIVLIGGICFLCCRFELAHAAFSALAFSVWLNCALMIGGLVGLGTSQMMAPGRYGTLLVYPGSLWRIAIAVWVWSAYRLLRQRSFYSAALLLASTFVVVMDGARTAIVMLLIATIYMAYVLAKETGRVRQMVGAAMACGAIFAVFLIVLSSAANANAAGDSQTSGLNRAATLFRDVEERGGAGLQQADVARFAMIQDAVHAIELHPIWGTGFGTTTTQTAIGPMVVHMTYLQVWADLGILGLAAYTWIVWRWTIQAPRFLRFARAEAPPANRAIIYNSLFLLFMFGANGLFHPLSSEWSEWILFLIPTALLYHTVADARLPRNA